MSSGALFHFSIFCLAKKIEVFITIYLKMKTASGMIQLFKRGFKLRDSFHLRTNIDGEILLWRGFQLKDQVTKNENVRQKLKQ